MMHLLDAAIFTVIAIGIIAVGVCLGLLMYRGIK
jgi:hypothetical protein